MKCNEIEPGCKAQWPEARSMNYNPACCRFPKSCSANRCDQDKGHDGEHLDSSLPVGFAGRSWTDDGAYTG